MDRRPLFVIFASVLGLYCLSCQSRQNAPATAQTERRAADAQSSVSPPAAPATTVDQRPVIVAFGDSLTAGVVEHPYPEFLQELLDQNGLQYQVQNQGVSGDTTTDGLARIDNVISVHPDLVVLEFGGNDGLRGIPVDATKQNLAQMIERLLAAKLQVVLLGITLPPNYGPDYVKSFNAIFPALAQKYHLPLLPFLLIHVYQHPEWMQPDGIHPNADGNRVVAQDVFHLLEPVFKRRARGTR